MTTLTMNHAYLPERRISSASISTRNVGGYDRVLRLTLGVVLLADGLHGTGPIGFESLFVMAAALLILSAILAWDPLYALFKVRTATLRARAVSYQKVMRRNANGGINVGSVDRILRIVLAVTLLATPFLWIESIGLPAVLATLVSIPVMLTALTGWDPLYQMLGVRTATLPIDSAPEADRDPHVVDLTLIDPVRGDDDDVFQRAA